MTESKDQTTGRRWWGDALIIALLSALLYALNYSYESGFASYFGYPSNWVTVDLSVILRNIQILLFGLLLPMAAIFLIPPVVLMILIQPIALGLVIWKFVHPGLGPRWLYGFLVVAVGVMVVSYVIDFIRAFRAYHLEVDTAPPDARALYRGHGVYLNPVLAAAFGLRENVDARVMLLAILLLFGWQLPAPLARREAGHQTRFLVHVGNPPCLYLRSYEGSAICAGYDTAKSQLSGTFVLVPLGNSAWQSDSLGPFQSLGR